jgi:SAM-dependent methyltransferase
VSTHYELAPLEYELSRQGHMQRRRSAIVADVIAQQEGVDLVIELGCGPGALVASLAEGQPGLACVGLDVSQAMIEHARTAHSASNVTFEVVDLERDTLPLQAQVACSVDLVHHVHELDPFLTNVRAMLVPGATWVGIEPNRFHPYVFLSQERMKRRGLAEDHFRFGAFVRRLPHAGFALSSRRTAFVFPGSVDRVPRPLAWIERRLERLPGLGGSVVFVARAIAAVIAVTVGLADGLELAVDGPRQLPTALSH